MKSYVITILDLPESVNSGKKCIASGAKYGTEITMFQAFTPKSNPQSIAESQGISLNGFHERYSRFDNCLAAFLSHYALWKTAIDTDDEIQIFEHDAVIRAPLPELLSYKGCISFGAPSYGKFKIPSTIGVNKLVSKQYFPGAHAYRVKPEAAKIMIEKAKLEAGPTDVFLHNGRFDFLEEYYPWPVEAHDNFTTIQNENGCQAKHRNGPGYRII